jgi:hypothetical protein
MINPLIAYQLVKEHQRELTDQAQQRVLAHLANDADGGRLAAVAPHAVAPGVAALRRSPRATNTAHGMQRAHDPRMVP